MPFLFSGPLCSKKILTLKQQVSRPTHLVTLSGRFQIYITMLSLSIILLLNLLIVVSYTASLESPKKSDCDKSFMINKTNQVMIGSRPGKRYKAQSICSWSFFGDPKCTPAITCDEFDIQKLDKDCSAEHLSISDGSGRGKRFCGDGDVDDEKIQIRSKTRDLFVTFKAGISKKLTNGFKCKIHCAPEAKRLPTGKRSRKFALKENRRCICGLHNKDDRIMGGEDAKLNEFPWFVGIVHAGTRRIHCGGSIINDKYILSAAHCFSGNNNPKKFEILAHAQVLQQDLYKSHKPEAPFGKPGSSKTPGYNLSKVTDKDEKTQRYKVVKIINHPLYDPGFDYDIAVLELEKKIDFNKPGASTPICLPRAYGGPFDDDQYVGKIPTVMGWGLAYTGAGGSTRLLQKLKVPVINLEVCRGYNIRDAGPLTTRMMCAGYEEGGKDSCAGDSGGPLTYQKKNKQWLQIGIVSFGRGCGNKLKPGGYSRVVEMRSWINQNTPAATWCRTK